MTAEQLQDALTLLPGDLVLATDRLRTAPRAKVRPWMHLIPVAACLVVLLSAAMLLRQLPGTQKSDSAAQAPAAMAPAEAADEAAPQEAPAADEPASAITGTDAAPGEEENLNDSHRHLFADDSKAESGSGGWCGNTQARIYLDGSEYTLGGTDAIELTAILETLPYDPALVCRCMAEFSVDTELLTGIDVSLTQAFARCGLGQASLTQDQAETIRGILRSLEAADVG